MKKYLYRKCIELTNRSWSSNLLRKFTMSKISKYMIPSFIKYYQINKNEFELPYNEYTTLHELFIRKLKKESRPISMNHNEVISPVDAVIESTGKIEQTTEILVKGKIYSLVEMLGDAEKAEQYREGTYMVFYLSPKDYHRIHSPINGQVEKRWELGNRSYPVNRLGLLYGKNPLSKNYRVITELKHESGKLAVVKVGAMFVNTITYTNEQTYLRKGEEFAYFSFGSTVVLLFEKGTFSLNRKIISPYVVKMGQSIGSLH